MVTSDMEQRLAKINELPNVAKAQTINTLSLNRPLILIEYHLKTNSKRILEQDLCEKALEILKWKMSVRSHTHQAILLSDAPLPFGLDLERTDRPINEKVRQKLLHYFKKEDVKRIDTLALWCLWEATFKATQLYEKIEIIESKQDQASMTLKVKQGQQTLQLTLQNILDYWIATCHLL